VAQFATFWSAAVDSGPSQSRFQHGDALRDHPCSPFCIRLLRATGGSQSQWLAVVLLVVLAGLFYSLNVGSTCCRRSRPPKAEIAQHLGGLEIWFFLCPCICLCLRCLVRVLLSSPPEHAGIERCVRVAADGVVAFTLGVMKISQSPAACVLPGSIIQPSVAQPRPRAASMRVSVSEDCGDLRWFKPRLRWRRRAEPPAVKSPFRHWKEASALVVASPEYASRNLRCDEKRARLAGSLRGHCLQARCAHHSRGRSATHTKLFERSCKHVANICRKHRDLLYWVRDTEERMLTHPEVCTTTGGARELETDHREAALRAPTFRSDRKGRNRLRRARSIASVRHFRNTHESPVNGVRLYFDVEGAGLTPAGRDAGEADICSCSTAGPRRSFALQAGLFSALADVAQVVYLDHRAMTQ